MYNVLEKLRSGEALTAKEKVIHEKGLVSVLKEIHDDLDAAVFDAYGWPHDLADEEILERLVKLNAERAEEEKRGIIRWLRPEFQNPDTKQQPTQTSLTGVSPLPAEDDDEATKIGIRGEAPGARGKADRPAWPKSLPEQITAIRALTTGATTVDAKSIAAQFKAARTAQVEEVLASLAALGLLVAVSEKPRKWRAVS
jgi:hypothetical protein